MKLTRLFALFLAAAVVTGCRAGADDPPGVTRADSLGVRLITSAGDDRPLTWTFDSLSVLVDSTGAPMTFNRVAPEMVVTDRIGRTYVLRNQRELLRFDRDGRLDHVIARDNGDQSVILMGRSLRIQGDSLVVVDGARMDLPRWSPTLDPLPPLILIGGLQFATDVGFRTGGAWALSRRLHPDGQRDLYIIGDTITREPLVSVSQPKGRVPQGCDPRSTFPMLPLFTPEITWAVQGSRIVANVGPAYDIRLFEGARPVAAIRRTLEPNPVDLGAVRRLYPFGIRLRSPDGRECSMTADQLVSELGNARLVPLVHGLSLLNDGTIWVLRSLRGEEPVLDVFSTTGAYVGTVRGMHLPVGRLNTGELLVPRPAASGGFVVSYVRVTQ